MFGISTQEMFIILLLVLLLFGANRIPEVARSVGKGLREFRKAANEFQRAIESDDVLPPVVAAGSGTPGEAAADPSGPAAGDAARRAVPAEGAPPPRAERPPASS
jgi:TatA/E family protein of Tat protein translocase